jgi:hypothetical protein
VAEADAIREITGGCPCGTTRFSLLATPLFVHVCHCTDCQQLTGSAFVRNVIIETSAIDVTDGSVEQCRASTTSGRIIKTHICADCEADLWRHYPGTGQRIAYVRTSMLDRPELFPPQAHIYTRSALPSTMLPDNVPKFKAHYRWASVWPQESCWRRLALDNLRKQAEGVPAMQSHLQEKHI